jgi:hypothetical protein
VIVSDLCFALKACTTLISTVRLGVRGHRAPAVGVYLFLAMVVPRGRLCWLPAAQQAGVGHGRANRAGLPLRGHCERVAYQAVCRAKADVVTVVVWSTWRCPTRSILLPRRAPGCMPLPSCLVVDPITVAIGRSSASRVSLAVAGVLARPCRPLPCESR